MTGARVDSRSPAASAVGVAVVLWSTAYRLSAIILGTPSPAVLRLALAVPLLALIGILMAKIPVRDDAPHVEAAGRTALALPPPVSAGPAPTHAAGSRHPHQGAHP